MNLVKITPYYYSFSISLSRPFIIFMRNSIDLVTLDCKLGHSNIAVLAYTLVFS